MNRANGNIQTALQQGLAHFQSGRLEQAEQVFRDVLTKVPSDINALQFLGLVVFQLGRPSEGEALLRKAIRKNGKIAKLHFNLGHMLDAQGKLKEALIAYRDAQKLNPQDEWILISLAVVYGKMGRSEEGVSACRRALKLNPKSVHALTNLGQLLWITGKSSEAIKYLEEALEIRPDFQEALSRLGGILLSEGELGRAENVLRRAIDVGPRNPEVLENLAGVLLSRGEDDEALALCQESVEIAPNRSDAHYNLGKVFLKLDRLQEAIASYHKAISIVPDWLEVYGILGSLYEKTHDIENAEAVVNKALSIDPGHHLSLYNRAVLLRRQGKIKEAIDILESMNSTDIVLNIKVNFELGRLFDLDHNSAKALHYFSLANKAAYESSKDADDIKAESLVVMDQLEEMIVSDGISKVLSRQTSADMDEPVFLVGFPRSGTTLLDQILDSHSKIQVMEEQPALGAVRSMIKDLPGGYPSAMTNLSIETIDGLRDEYFKVVASSIEKDPNAILVDKLPLNLLHIPLINLLFPHAKIIFAMRHPCDVILSNFMQHFSVNIAMANFFSLDDAAHYYGRTMSLWERYVEKLSLDYYVVKYESLVDGFTDEVNGILGFLGLDWEDGIEQYNKHAEDRVIKTPSYQSVVEPIYGRAKYRWERYAAELEPYCRALQPFVDRFGYSEAD